MIAKASYPETWRLIDNIIPTKLTWLMNVMSTSEFYTMGRQGVLIHASALTGWKCCSDHGVAQHGNFPK